jgi:hypothetical protein
MINSSPELMLGMIKEQDTDNSEDPHKEYFGKSR